MKSFHKDTELFFPALRNKILMSKTSIRRILERTLKEMNKPYTKDQIDTKKCVIR